MQEGRYAKWAELLQAAEAAPDSQERMLGVCRLMLCFCTDMLRASNHFADKPSNILERHQVHRSQLGKYVDAEKAQVPSLKVTCHDVMIHDDDVYNDNRLVSHASLFTEQPLCHGHITANFKLYGLLDMQVLILYQ